MFKIKTLIVTMLFAVLFLVGCQPAWEIDIKSGNEAIGQITKDSVTYYIENAPEEISEIPLGQFLFDNGFTIIDDVSFFDVEGESEKYDWNVIGQTATITESGEIRLDETISLTPTAILVEPGSLASSIPFSIMDIAPTMASALGLPQLPEAHGKVIYETKVEHGVMVLLDGLQYQKILALIEADQLPFFKQVVPIQKGLTVYPPVTTSASASFLTGAPPSKTGVFGYGFRSTELTTIFDLAVREGKTVAAVEGTSVPFNLRNADVEMSGDRDGNGYYDDNVMKNSLDVIQSEIPDLLYIHFQEIDDMGHEFSPDSEEYESAIIRVDTFLSEIFNALPEKTLMIIFADHGMHTTADGGNHGTLIASDLIIPIIFLEK